MDKLLLKFICIAEENLMGGLGEGWNGTFLFSYHWDTVAL